MLTPRALRSPRHARGFTLVELMVAMVLGLLVVSAVLAFIFSLIRANSETVLSTRLNQEMRATMSLIANDVRRARGMSDPIAAVGQNGSVANPHSIVVIPSATCIRYSYSEDPTAGATNFRAIRLNAGKVELVRAATAGAATCGTAGIPLNSDGVTITGLNFTNPGGNARRIDVELTGELRNKPAYMTENQAMSITQKTIRQTISIRSNGT